GGVGHRTEVGVLRSACERLDFRAREPKRRSQLHQQPRLANGRADPSERLADSPNAAAPDGRVAVAVRSGEIHEPAAGERALQGLGRFLVDLAPATLVDRSELSEQVVHSGTLPSIADAEIVGRTGRAL